jgi:hypothetical protein
VQWRPERAPAAPHFVGSDDDAIELRFETRAGESRPWPFFSLEKEEQLMKKQLICLSLIAAGAAHAQPCHISR